MSSLNRPRSLLKVNISQQSQQSFEDQKEEEELKKSNINWFNTKIKLLVFQ